MPSFTIAFIGLGNMGEPMARNLQAAGHTVRVHDLVEAKAAAVVAAGATWCPDLATVVQGAQVVMLSLPGPPEVEAVALGPTGVLAHAARGTVLIDTTTSSIPMIEQVAAAAAERGIDVLESPVTNAIDAAERGELTTFVAGQRAVFDRMAPVYDAIAEKALFVGKHGNAATIKVMTNMLWFVNACAIGEGLMMGAKAGVPLETVWEAITSSAGNSWVAEHDVPSIFAGHYDPSFTLALCNKDMGIVQDIARAQGHRLPMADAAQARFQMATERYGPDAAELHVVKLLEEAAGLLLRPPHGQPVAKETDA